MVCQVVVERAVVRSSWKLDSEKLGEMETGEELVVTESVTHPQVESLFDMHLFLTASLACDNGSLRNQSRMFDYDLQTGVERVRFSFLGRDAWTSVASTNGVVILRQLKLGPGSTC